MANVILELCLLLSEWQVYSFFLLSCAAKATDTFYDCANFLSVQGVIKFFLIYFISQEVSRRGEGIFKHTEKLFIQYIARFIRGSECYILEVIAILHRSNWPNLTRLSVGGSSLQRSA